MIYLQTGSTITYQMDLLREQMKMLAGEVALCTSSLKRLLEQAASNPEDSQLQVSYILRFSPLQGECASVIDIRECSFDDYVG